MDRATNDWFDVRREGICDQPGISRQLASHETPLPEQPDMVWPPPPRRLPPEPSNIQKYQPFWLIEDSVCFVLSLFVSLFSWGLLSLPLLLITTATAFLVKSIRAKRALIYSAWGAGLVVLLFIAAIIYDNIDTH